MKPALESRVVVVCVKSQLLREANFIESLANIYTCYGFRSDKSRLQIAMLTAYFDESGTHEGDHWCVVAGFVGNDAQWTAFVADWIAAIKPRLNLHMTELRWKQHPERIAPLLAKLGPIPHKYNLKAVAASLKWSDYNTIVKGKVRERFTKPYQICAQACMAIVLGEIAGSDHVAFVFDRQEGMRREVMDTMSNVVFDRIGVDSRIKGVSFVKRTDTVCLDPADYLAFTIRERSIDENSPKAKLAETILGNAGHGGQIGPHMLRWMVDSLDADGFTPGKPLPDRVPPTLVRDLMQNPYWRGPR